MNFSEIDPAMITEVKDSCSTSDQCATDRRHSISIIFPAFNEEENITKAVEHGRKAMSKFFTDIEIIVVNDGSSDATASIIDELAAEQADVVPVHHEVNRGYGAALRSGIYKASKDLIFFTDSDLQFDLEEIRHLQEWIHRYDIVAGYRARRADPVHRRFNAWGWNVLVRLILGLKIKDIDCAFKLFRREVFQNIRLETVGAMINTEILTLAQRNKMRIKEVPVSHYPRLAGEQTGANFKVILKALRELFVMREKLRLRAGEIRRDAVSYKSRYNEL
jgi:glycosyltransferase involved in cell wall biosynthesis